MALRLHRPSAPGYNIPDKDWFEVHGPKARSLPPDARLVARVIPAGTTIKRLDSKRAEVFFVRRGVVAADVHNGRTPRRHLLRRGARFSPESQVGAAKTGRSIRFTAFTDVSVYILPVTRGLGAVQDVFASVRKRASHISSLASDALEALRSVAPWSRMPASVLLDLIILEGTVLDSAAKKVVVSSREPGLYILVNCDGTFGDDDPLLRGQTTGAAYTGSRDFVVNPRPGGAVIFIPGSRIENFRAYSPGFRRAYDREKPAMLPEGAVRASQQMTVLATTIPESDLSPDLHRAIGSLLAQALAASGDRAEFRTLLLVLTDRPNSRRSVRRPYFAEKLVEKTMSLDEFDPHANEFATFRYVLLLVENPTRPRINRLRDIMARVLAPSFSIALLTFDSLAPLPAHLDPLRDFRIDRVQLLGGAISDVEPGHHPRAIRVRLQLNELARVRPPDLRNVPSATSAAIFRIVRGLTDRLVGVALGGGAAWVYAHVALLEEMLDADVPIDLVSGGSGGALIGAYFCALGRDGLALLRERGWLFNLALIGGVVDSRALAIPPSIDLRGRRLQDLDVPLLPVIADLTHQSEFIPTVGPLGTAVRASSTLVPLTGPTTAFGRRCADAVFINNTGERPLAARGAALIISSDVAQAPGNAPSNSLFGRLYRMRRLRDMVDAPHLLVKQADEKDRHLADALFRPTGLPSVPFDMSRGAAIEQAAREQARAFVAGTVRPLWRALRRD